MFTDLRAEQFEFSRRGVRWERIQLGEEQGMPGLSIAQAAGGAGPTVLVVGGTHGDEFEGQFAALELARALGSLTIHGRLLVVPFHNEAACRAGTRVSPIDGQDLNRLYGVDAPDGPTARVARFVEQHIMPEIDFLIDLHSGGDTHEFVLSSNLQAALGSDEHQAMLPPLLAFDAPYAIVFDEAGENAMPHRGTLEGAARGLGKAALSSEIGGGGRTTEQSLAVARRGLANLLHHIGVVRSSTATSWRESRSRVLTLSRPEEHLAAPAAGWFSPDVRLGTDVEAGQRIGSLVPEIDAFGPPIPVESATEGVVVALPARTRQAAGAQLAFVASVP
jgi:predicted deacylase